MRFLALTNIWSGDAEVGEVETHPLLVDPVLAPITTEVERMIPDMA